MSTKRLRIRGWSALALVGAVSGYVESSAAAADKIKADLVPSVTAIAPGATVDVGLRFRIVDGWHIYWQNPGDAGQAPRMTWQLPQGFKVDPLQFPVPRVYTDAGGITSNVLEDSPVLVISVTAPDRLAVGQRVTLAGEVKVLVCKETCLQERHTVSLELPVVASAGEMAPANEDVFKAARRALPVASTKYLSIRAKPATAEIRPEEPFELLVRLEIGKDYHIQSDRPLVENLIGTLLLLERVEHVLTETPRFPAPIEREMPGVGKLTEFGGETIVRVPVTVLADYEHNVVPLGGILKFQACSSTSNKCFPPETVAWRVNVPISRAHSGNFEPATGAASTDALAAVDSPAGADRQLTPPSADSLGVAGRTWLDRAQGWFAGFGFVGYLIMAMIGGFILNFMPCVLPVISIKILSFVRQAREHRWRVFELGLAFSAGIIASFLVLAVIVVALDSQWGGLFQKPRFTIGMSAVVTALALSLFGVFSMNPPAVVNDLGEKVQGEGLPHAFGMGLMATVLGTACSAPFLGTAIAVATRPDLPRFAGIGIFLAAGIGMALPYAVLTYNPAWLKVVPKPGPWMETFERVVGFVLLATVVWLLYPLGSQIGAEGVLWTLVFLLFVSAAVWVFGKLQYGAAMRHRLRTYSIMGLLLVGGWLACFRLFAPIDELVRFQNEMRRGATVVVDYRSFEWTEADKIPWQVYTRERVDAAVRAGRTVFVDYTADWCANCKFNERVVLNTETVRGLMRELGVVPFKADYTSEDPEIKADLDRYGRGGVPIYIVIPACQPDKVNVLPETLTTSIVTEALQAAGRSTGECSALATIYPPAK